MDAGNGEAAGGVNEAPVVGEWGRADVEFNDDIPPVSSGAWLVLPRMAIKLNVDQRFRNLFLLLTKLNKLAHIGINPERLV